MTILKNQLQNNFSSVYADMIKLFWNYFLKNGSYEDCYVMFTRSKKVIDILSALDTVVEHIT